MLRTIWAIIVAIVVTIPLATTVLIIAMLSSASPLIDPVIRLWARLVLWGAGIEIRGEGMETIDRAKRYILIANHHSYFDIPCIFAAIPQPIRFMAKKSLFSIPIFGWAIGRAGFIPIDRKNRRTAVKSFDLAVERIRKGNTIVIFPEDHFIRRAGDDGEKAFEYDIRCLIRMGEQSISRPKRLSGAWQTLANDLLSLAYRSAMSSLTGLDLSEAPLEVNAFHYPPGG